MLPLDAAHRAISSVLTVRLLRNALSMISCISFCQVASNPSPSSGNLAPHPEPVADWEGGECCRAGVARGRRSRRRKDVRFIPTN